MVKYLGSKRTLVPAIAAAVEALGVGTACDLFAGTTRVGQALRRAGLAVHSNDLATYSEALGQAYIAAGDDVDRGRIRDLLAHLAALPGRRGYFTETFCERSRFFQPANGVRVDAIREEIDRLGARRRSSAACSSRPAGGRRPRRLDHAACRWRTSSAGRRAPSTRWSCASRRPSRARRGG